MAAVAAAIATLTLAGCASIVVEDAGGGDRSGGHAETPPPAHPTSPPPLAGPLEHRERTRLELGRFAAKSEEIWVETALAELDQRLARPADSADRWRRISAIRVDGLAGRVLAARARQLETRADATATRPFDRDAWRRALENGDPEAARCWWQRSIRDHAGGAGPRHELTADQIAGRAEIARAEGHARSAFALGLAALRMETEDGRPQRDPGRVLDLVDDGLAAGRDVAALRLLARQWSEANRRDDTAARATELLATCSRRLGVEATARILTSEGSTALAPTALVEWRAEAGADDVGARLLGRLPILRQRSPRRHSVPQPTRRAPTPTHRDLRDEPDAPGVVPPR